MKINKAKIMVATLAIAAVAATVGSISGTVAWFQYSTRVTAAYQGAVAHCSESLEIRIRSEDDTLGAWGSELSAATIGTYLSTATADKGAGRTTATNTLRPVTSGVLAENEVASTLYKNPIYQYPNMTDWGTATATEDYIILPLELRVKDVNGASTASYLAKKIYVTDLTISARADHDEYVKDDHKDVSSAIRVGVSAGQAGAAKTAYTTFSTTGGNTVVAGALDLGGPAGNDKEAGYSEWDNLDEIQYGYTTGEASSHVAKTTANTQLLTSAAATDVGVANDTDPYQIKGKEIGSTTDTKTLEVDLLIYLEGWTKLDGSALWDDKTVVGAEFNVGIRFSAEAHKATGE